MIDTGKRRVELPRPVLVLAWTLAVLALVLEQPRSAWSVGFMLAFATVVPALLLRLLGPLAAARGDGAARLERELLAKRHEAELLEALVDCRSLTPLTAAARTSLTTDQAGELLDALYRRDLVDIVVEEGAQVFALRDVDRRSVVEARAAGADRLRAT